MPDKLTPGGPPPTSAWLNELLALLERVPSVDPGSGLALISSGGDTAIAHIRDREMWVKLTWPAAPPASGGSYSWREQHPSLDGTWTDGEYRGYAQGDPARGTETADPALESNAYTEVPANTRVRARRDAGTGTLIFESNQCPEPV